MDRRRICHFVRLKLQPSCAKYFCPIWPAPHVNKTRTKDRRQIKRWCERLSEQVPDEQVDMFVNYSKQALATQDEALQQIEKKADWLMGLTVGAIGFGLLRLTDKHVDAEPYTWAVAQVLAMIGMLLCLRARIPRDYHTQSPPRKMQAWINQTKKWQEEHGDHPDGTQKVVKTQIAKNYALAAHGAQMIGKWKSRCVTQAGFYLAAAVVSLILSFGLRLADTHSDSGGLDPSVTVSTDGGGGGGGDD